MFDSGEAEAVLDPNRLFEVVPDDAPYHLVGKLANLHDGFSFEAWKSKYGK